MPRIHKRPPKQNLKTAPVLIEDTNFYSTYFEVNDLNRVFHAGRNGFLIRGSQYLRQNSNIAIEVLDREGYPVFATPVPNYSEGGGRLVSIEIYEDTLKGPGTLIILGEADQYADGRPIPSQWQGRFNVRWAVPIQIEPSNPNITQIRLANRPTAEVEEKNFFTTQKLISYVTSSQFTASLTYDFIGQKSDGYAIVMQDASDSPVNFFTSDQLNAYFTGSLYKTVYSKLYDSGVEVPTSTSVLTPQTYGNVYMPLDKVLNNTVAITNTPIKFQNKTEFPTNDIHNGTFEIVTKRSDLGSNLERRVVEQYTASIFYSYRNETVIETASTSSIVSFRIPYVSTHTGKISKVKISAKESNDSIGSYQPFAEFVPGERNILVQTSSIGFENIGTFDDQTITTNNWFASYWYDVNGNFNSNSYNNSSSATGLAIPLVTSSERILDGVYTDVTESVDHFFGTKVPIEFYDNVEYTLKYTAVYSPSRPTGSNIYTTSERGNLKVYLTRIGNTPNTRSSSSVVLTDFEPYGLLVDEIKTKTHDKSLYEKEVNFTVPRSGLAHLRFVEESGFWDFGKIEITPAVEYGFNPDEILFDAENNYLVNSTNTFKIQFLDFQDSPIDYTIITDPVYLSGSVNVKFLRLISDRGSFVFDNSGNPSPALQTASMDLLAQNISEATTWTVVNDDDVPVSPLYYDSTNSTLKLYINAFGSPPTTSSVLVTAQAGGLTDKYRVVKIQDGGVGVNATQYVVVPLNGTALKNRSGSLEAQLKEIDGSTVTELTSGPILLRKLLPTGTLVDLTTLGGITDGGNGINYNPIISSSAITGSFELAAVDTGAGNNILDTLTYIDVTDGIPVGSVVPSNGLILLRERPSNNYTPENTRLTATFYDREGTTYTDAVGVSASYSDPNDRMEWNYETDNPDVTLTVTDSGGSSVSEGVLDTTKALNFIWTFTDPFLGDSISVAETVIIASDGLDGSDGADGVNAKIVTLTSDDYQIAYDSSSKNPDPTSVELSASAVGFTDPIYRFENDTDATVIQDWSGSGVTDYTVPTFRFKSKNIAVKVAESASHAAPVIEATDSLSIFGTQDGQDGITVILTNETHAFSADQFGNVSDYSGGGTNIEVYQGNKQLTVDNSAPYQTGSFRIGTPTGTGITAGAVTQSNGEISASLGWPSNMTSDQAEIEIPVIITTFDYQVITVTKLQTFAKSNAGTDGADGQFYYIDPLDGRSFKTDNTGTTTPSALRFNTRRSLGDSTIPIDSSSVYGLYFSSSLAPVSGTVSDSLYTVYPTDIIGHDVLLFKSGSGLPATDYSNIVDTIDVTDLTDGLDAIIPLFEIQGPIVFKSSSTGIIPTTATRITGSLVRNASVLEYIRMTVGPVGDDLQGTLIESSSINISSSFFANTSTPVKDLTVYVFSGSVSPQTVLTETFFIADDGSPGLAAGYVTSTNGFTLTRDQTNTYTPENTQLTANFVDTYGNLYIEDIGVTASYSAPNDRLQWDLEADNGNITVNVTGSSGTPISEDTPTNTRIANFIFTFTEPSSGNITKASATVQITVDGVDGGDGSDGVDAKAATLYADRYVITYNGDGIEDPAGQKIGLTGSAYNHTGSVYYEFLRDGVSKQNTTADTYEVPDVDEPTGGDSVTYMLKTREGSAGSTVVATDTISVYGVQAGPSGSDGSDGTDAITIVLTNETHTFPADSEGTVYSYAGGGTRIYAYEGATKLTPDGFSPYNNSSFRVASETGSNITPGSEAYLTDYISYPAPSNMTQISASIEFHIIVKRSNGTEQSFRRIQSFGKSLQGSQGGQGPGLVYIGEYDNLNGTFTLTNDGIRRDIVSVGGTFYYYSSSDATKNALEADQGSPTGSNGSNYWGTFTEFAAVATDILLAQDAYIDRVLNIGAETLAPEARITLNGGTEYSYLSIGQSGNQDYAQAGIFLGSGSAAKFSLSGSNGSLLWDGSTLTINGGGVFSGDLSAAGGTFSGDLSAAGGTFTGDLSAASGSFTGTVTAGAIQGGIISGSAINIGDGLVDINPDGSLTASAAYIIGHVEANSGLIGGFVIDDDHIYSLDQNIIMTASSGQFTASAVDLSGKIQATAGSIGGFNIDSDHFWSTNQNIIMTASSGEFIAKSGKIGGFNIDADHFWSDNQNLIMTASSGQFTASAANITGEINATGGTIGGFTITATQLSSSNFILDTSDRRLSVGAGNNVIVSDADNGFWIGSSVSESAPFFVDLNGNVYATNFIGSGSGNIYSGSGYFDGLFIRDRLDILADGATIDMNTETGTATASIQIGQVTGHGKIIADEFVGGYFDGDGSRLINIPGTGFWYFQASTDGTPTSGEVINSGDNAKFQAKATTDNPMLVTRTTDTMEFDIDVSGVAAGTYGNAATAIEITVNNRGFVENVNEHVIAISVNDISGLPLPVISGGLGVGTLSSGELLVGNGQSNVLTYPYDGSRGLSLSGSIIGLDYTTPSNIISSVIKEVTSPASSDTLIVYSGGEVQRLQLSNLPEVGVTSITTTNNSGVSGSDTTGDINLYLDIGRTTQYSPGVSNLSSAAFAFDLNGTLYHQTSSAIGLESFSNTNTAFITAPVSINDISGLPLPLVSGGLGISGVAENDMIFGSSDISGSVQTYSFGRGLAISGSEFGIQYIGGENIISSVIKEVTTPAVSDTLLVLSGGEVQRLQLTNLPETGVTSVTTTGTSGLSGSDDVGTGGSTYSGDINLYLDFGKLVEQPSMDTDDLFAIKTVPAGQESIISASAIGLEIFDNTTSQFITAPVSINDLSGLPLPIVSGGLGISGIPQNDLVFGTSDVSGSAQTYPFGRGLAVSGSEFGVQYIGGENIISSVIKEVTSPAASDTLIVYSGGEVQRLQLTNLPQTGVTSITTTNNSGVSGSETTGDINLYLDIGRTTQYSPGVSDLSSAAFAFDLNGTLYHQTGSTIGLESFSNTNTGFAAGTGSVRSVWLRTPEAGMDLETNSGTVNPFTGEGDISILLDLSELTDLTADMTTSDEFIVLDNSVGTARNKQKRKGIAEISLGLFDNTSTNFADGTVTSIATNNGITGGTITTTGTVGLTGQALAFHNLSTNGLVTRTAASSITARTITGTTNQITVTNGNGVSGNPTISLPSSVYGPSSFGLSSAYRVLFDSGNTQIDFYVASSNEFRMESDGDFHADGDIVAYSSTISSDINLKKDISIIDRPLEKVKQLKGVEFTWKRNEKRSAGLIAQDVEVVLPQAVHVRKALKTEEEYKTLNYDAVIGLLVEAIKEQQKEIENLKKLVLIK